jgi:hypothetical protein
VQGELLVDVDELAAGLFLASANHLASSASYAEVRHLADLNDFFANLLGCLPLLEQMVALHQSKN